MARMRTPIRVATALALTAFVCTGCAERRGALPAHDSGRNGLVYLFPGIDGGDFSLSFVRAGIQAAGVKAQIRIFEWANPLDPLGNLQNLVRNRADARRVAAELA